MNYFITGIFNEENKIQRTIISGAENKFDAMKKFIEFYPQILILSVIQINQKERKWLLENNMLNCKNDVFNKGKMEEK